MYSEKDFEEFVHCVREKKQFDDMLYDVFVRNQEKIMALMVDEDEDAILCFIENLQGMNFYFNGMFCHRPLAAIMLDHLKYQKFKIYRKLFECDIDLNLCCKSYRKVISNASVYGFENEGTYDVLLIFLEHDYIEALYTHGVNISKFILSSDFYPEPRTINQIIKFDHKNRFRDSLLEKRNYNLKEEIREEFNNIYNLFFD
jgi:hypothetical protein